MRVLLFSHGYPPTISGVTKVVQKLGRALVQYGHQVNVVTASDRGNPYRAEDGGVSLIRLRSWPNPVWSEGPLPIATRRTVQRILVECQPDIIHTHENAVFGNQLIRLRDQLEVPLVASCHALPEFALSYLPNQKVVEKSVSLFIWRYLIWHLSYFDAVVFPTQAQRSIFLKRGLRSTSTAISNGVDVNRFFPDPCRAAEFEKASRLPPPPRLLFVGRLCRDKRIDLLIRAMPEIRRHRPAHLLIAGRGDEKASLESLAQELGLTSCVHFLGYVPDVDLPDLYRAADVFVIASTCEVQSIPTLEATVSGLPVVAVNAGALPELVQDGINGYLVSPGDEIAFGRAVQRILGHPQTAREFGQASRRIGRQHAEVRTFRAFIDLYQQLLTSWYTPASAYGASRTRTFRPEQRDSLAPNRFGRTEGFQV